MVDKRKSTPNSMENNGKVDNNNNSTSNNNNNDIKTMKNKNDDDRINNYDFVGLSLLLIVIIITIVSWQQSNSTTIIDEKEMKMKQVFFYSWLTAVSTGIGAIPFYIFNEPNKFWMGISNAAAGGMMLAASCSLALEGIDDESNYIESFYGMENIEVYGKKIMRTVIGFIIGILFIIITKKFLDQYEDIKLGSIEGSSAQKMVLIVFVMTLHSLTEGVGIGVSFAGKEKLGQFISLSLAVHNIPEGLAVALVLTSRKVSKLRSALWAIFTSIPQPLMALPAFLFVENFKKILPVGLGFASGAMSFVAIFELLVEAIEDTNISVTGIVGVLAFILMWFLQELVKTIA